jgi:hypothetical protein
MEGQEEEEGGSHLRDCVCFRELGGCWWIVWLEL